MFWLYLFIGDIVILAETLFLPSSDRADTTIWMHYVDANLTAGEKT